MNDLVEFLLERIAQEEYAAQGATDPDWQQHGYYTPTRVLAECEAKRRIVQAHYVKGNAGSHECPDESGAEPFWAPNSDDRPEWRWCSTLRLLALPYADHPDYRSEWAP